MCGRYVLTASQPELMSHFGCQGSFCMTPRYNISPGTHIPVVTEMKGRLGFMSWGYIPHWQKQENPSPLINARTETIEEKPSFKESFLKRRCLIPSNGFYEWKPLPSGKQPYFIAAQDDRLMAFAGIYDRWRRPTGEEVETCAILTMPATAAIQGVHSRMPVILTPEQYETWLNPKAKPETVKSLIAGSACLSIRTRPVSKRINDPAFEDPLCVQSV